MNELELTDVKIITKQIIINTPTSSHLIPITADEKSIQKIQDVIDEHESLKKPPTADELCKALSEQLKLKVSYSAKQFYYKIENTECIMFVTETYGDGLWSINEYIPPHLITMIGRFYEGLK